MTLRKYLTAGLVTLASAGMPQISRADIDEGATISRPTTQSSDIPDEDFVRINPYRPGLLDMAREYAIPIFITMGVASILYFGRESRKKSD